MRMISDRICIDMNEVLSVRSSYLIYMDIDILIFLKYTDRAKLNWLKLHVLNRTKQRDLFGARQNLKLTFTVHFS